ncbi:MAG: hypothetical protein MJ007_07395 [Paludibacteraceae bacterium]|nr:hypothetical protein [Paludibacteraceae bacterium]
MKTLKIYLAIIGITVAISVSAQRPIWLIGHGANWPYSLAAALNDGANGVEIDVKTKDDVKGSHWCVGHDKYYKEQDCTGNVMTLKKYLAQESLNDPRFCLLWIDVKTEKYFKQLVEYVHKYTPNGTEYSIVYNLYTAGAVTGIEQWLTDNLRDNEGINFGDVSSDKLSNLFSGPNPKLPKEKHFFTRGIFNSKWITRDSDRRKDITYANNQKKQGQFCIKAGVWSASTASDAFWFFDSKTADRDTDYDVVIAYFKKGYCGLPFTSPTSLYYCRKDYIDNPGKNNGKMRMADRNDTFFLPVPKKK